TSASECAVEPLAEESGSSRMPTPSGGPDAEVGKVVVRGTFLHVEDEGSLRGRFRALRRLKTDSAVAGVFDELDPYEPGKISSNTAREDLPQATEAAASPVASPPRLARQPAASAGKTTVMLRNIPNNYTRDMVLELLDEHGFAGAYNFVYLPFDFTRDANLGYAFVNLESCEVVDALWNTFDGFSNWSLPTVKVCQVCWSGPHQGFQAHVERYRNSPVMHKFVPDQYKPVIFKHGVRKPFPRPTKKIRAPHMAMGYY
ncbi:ML3, partial [Symbiodinium pilosum]